MLFRCSSSFASPIGRGARAAEVCEGGTVGRGVLLYVRDVFQLLCFKLFSFSAFRAKAEGERDIWIGKLGRNAAQFWCNCQFPSFAGPPSVGAGAGPRGGGGGYGRWDSSSGASKWVPRKVPFSKGQELFIFCCPINADSHTNPPRSGQNSDFGSIPRVISNGPSSKVRSFRLPTSRADF